MSKIVYPGNNQSNGETGEGYWDDLRVPLTSTKRGGSKDPGFIQFMDNGSESQGVFAFAFDASSEEELYFEVQIPHRWKSGTALRPHIHWSPSTAAAGNVVWGLEYTIKEFDAVFGNTTLITVTDSTDETAKKHLLAEFADITCPAGSLSAMLCGRLYRDATNELDTYAADAFALEFDLHYQIDSLGSRDEYTK